MQVAKLSYTTNFGRAFTTKEKEDYKKLMEESRKLLSIKDTSAIVFDFNVPSEKGFNLGTGTTFSNSMIEFSNFIKDMTGITSIQMAPQGQISVGNTSPYSATNYALGSHLIDLKKLISLEYAELLTDEDITNAANNYKGDKNKLEFTVDYDNIIGTDCKRGMHDKLLKKALVNFHMILSLYDEDALRLNYEMEQFIKNNKSWLEPEIMFTVLTEEYGTQDCNEWEDEDRDLYTNAVSVEDREKRIKQLNEEYKDLIEFENFKQFLAYKQQIESKKDLNNQGIKVYGDCLLGFSKSEIWANKDCFDENYYYGGPDPNFSDTNGIQTWGLRAVDYSKIGEIDKNGDISNLNAAGMMLYNKFHKFFERYDGVRMDAAWQFVTPFVYEETNGNYNRIQIDPLNDKILNIVNAAAKDVFGKQFDSKNPNNIMLELVGLSSDQSKTLTKNKYPHLFTTSFAEYGETPAKLKHEGYKSSKFYTGVGNHDNNTLVELANDNNKRKKHLDVIKDDFKIDMSKFNFSIPEYQNLSNEEKQIENFRNAKFAEIFTTGKQFFTLPDMFGMKERINISGKVSKDNWTVRIPTDYEKFYFSQLSKGYGLNAPKSLENAFYMKQLDYPEFTEKLAQAAEVLRSHGPMSEKEANELDKKGLLKNKFEYYV